MKDKLRFTGIVINGLIVIFVCETYNCPNARIIKVPRFLVIDYKCFAYGQVLKTCDFIPNSYAEKYDYACQIGGKVAEFLVFQEVCGGDKYRYDAGL